MLCIAVLCGAAGHSNRGDEQPRGGGRKAELSERAGQKTAGVSQGGDNPLGCVLCLLSVASQKVGASAARAVKRGKVIGLPERVGPRRGTGRLRPGAQRPLPLPGGNATENRTHGHCRAAGRSLRSRSSSSGHWYPPWMTTSCSRCCQRTTTYRSRTRGSPGCRWGTPTAPVGCLIGLAGKQA